MPGISLRLMPPSMASRSVLAVALVLASASSPALLADFVRGDTDGDGKVDLTDAVAFLDSMFRGGAPFSCEDAADSNDDGRLDLSDAVTILNHLFSGGDPLPAPALPACGDDPTADSLVCKGYASCE